METISDTKAAIIAMVIISGIVSGVILQTGVGTDQLDAVFCMCVGAIAGIVSK